MTGDATMITAAKKRLRTDAIARRSETLARLGPDAATQLANRTLAFLADRTGVTVSAFASMPDELDTAPLLLALARHRYRLALPVMQGKAAPLVFRLWQPGDAMEFAKWGIQEPLPDKPTVDPDVLLVPLLAFDRHGYRLGYGGGYYDRTLAALRQRKATLAVGLALDEQEVDAVPHLDYDERLDWVLTPSGPRDLRD